ncbi:MAG: TatD family deoxyribonuclease [Actinobacteria bacterium]|jgi:TatD DNase family protein|nr:MAG: TatD family deoxyribonuclease [Actinomycetota bacterium]
MNLVDTHAHLDLLKEDVGKALGTAAQAGVTKVITIGIDVESSRRAVEYAHRFPQVRAVVGMHPHDALDLDDAALRELARLAADPRVVGIGETGLDFYRDLSPRGDQERAFRKLLELARELELPVVVHDREAHADTMRILEEYAPFAGRLIMHCFSGDLEMARAVMDMGGYISVAGPVTFHNARKLQDIVRELPLEKLLIETDCPFLSPHPYRGKPNSPWRVRVIAEKVAELKGIPVEDLSLPDPFQQRER